MERIDKTRQDRNRSIERRRKGKGDIIFISQCICIFLSYTMAREGVGICFSARQGRVRRSVFLSVGILVHKKRVCANTHMLLVIFLFYFIYLKDEAF